jgi:hypothetical protein
MRTRSILGVSTVLAAAALLAAGCGSSNKNNTTTTSPTVTWASGLCTAITTYQKSLTTIANNTAKLALSKSALQQAVTQAKDATDTFVSTVKGLGTPQTTAGADAKKTVDTLATQLQDGADKIAAASSGSTLNTISVVSSTLITAQDQLKTAITQLKQLDAKGELQSAFKQAPACANVSGL